MNIFNSKVWNETTWRYKLAQLSDAKVALLNNPPRATVGSITVQMESADLVKITHSSDEGIGGRFYAYDINILLIALNKLKKKLDPPSKEDS